MSLVACGSAVRVEAVILLLTASTIGVAAELEPVDHTSRWGRDHAGVPLWLRDSPAVAAAMSKAWAGSSPAPRPTCEAPKVTPAVNSNASRADVVQHDRLSW